MPDTPTRRTVLQAGVATSSFGKLATRTVNAKYGPDIRTVEAALYYDIEFQADFSTVRLNSRPLYTIDDERNSLILSKKSQAALANNIKETGALMNEKPVPQGGDTPITQDSSSTQKLPIKYSSRRRPVLAVLLAKEHKLPKVILQRRSNNPMVVVPPGKSIELEPETNHKIRLTSTHVTVETVSRGDGHNGSGGEYRTPNREYDSVEVEVTPVVDVADHGELELRFRKFP